MNRILNILTALTGASMIITGLLCSFNMFSSFEMHWNDAYVIIPNYTSVIYNLIVNIIGGGAILYHAASTFNFKKDILRQHENITDNESENVPELKPMPKGAFITGFITIVVSFWEIIRSVALLNSFKGMIIQLLPLFILVAILYGITSLLPIVLAGQNLSLNNKIEAILEKRAVALRTKERRENKTRRTRR